MNQLSKHDVNKLTAVELKAKLPFEMISDSEVIAVVLPAYDVNKAELAQFPIKPNTKTQYLIGEDKELRFSKGKQVSGFKWAREL